MKEMMKEIIFRKSTAIFIMIAVIIVMIAAFPFIMTGCLYKEADWQDHLLKEEDVDDLLTEEDKQSITGQGNNMADSNNMTDSNNNSNKIKEDKSQVYTKIKYIPEIDYRSVSPLEFLDILKQHPGYYYTFTSFPDGWIKYKHVMELAKYVDSEEPCARVVLTIMSYLPETPSTVGNEAMFLIADFFRIKFASSFDSKNFAGRDAQWYKTELGNYFKDRINEKNTFVYLRSPDNPGIELSEIRKYSNVPSDTPSATPAMIYTVYDQEELETVISMIESKTCIWIDCNAVDAIDKDWLYKKAIEEKCPVILIGNGNALYSFRDLLLICRYMRGPKIPGEEIQKNGFSAYLLLSMDQAENSLTVSSVMRGFPGTPDVREIVSVSNKLLAGGFGLIENENATNEERFLYNFWAMKSDPENEELIDRVLQSFKDINWLRLSALDSNDAFIVINWFGCRSLDHDNYKTLTVLLENREDLHGDISDSYYGLLTKILGEKPEVFIKGLAALDNEHDIDDILFYFKHGLDNKKVYEKKLTVIRANPYLTEKEKEVLERLIDAVAEPLTLIEHNQPIVRAENEAVKVVKVKNEDINGDGKAENIEYTVTARPHAGVQDVVLKINDAEIALRMNNPSSDFHIVDINQSDKYKEIDIYDDGPSDDPQSTFFIYDGKDIIKIGELYTYDYYLDGKSKILSNFDMIGLFEPVINVGWTEMNENHKFSHKPVDKNSFINKQYEIAYSQDSEGTPWRLFKTYNANPYGNDYIAEVNEGDKVIVMDVVNQGSRNVAFKVRLENGIEGWLIHLFGGD